MKTITLPQVSSDGAVNDLHLFLTAHVPVGHESQHERDHQWDLKDHPKDTDESEKQETTGEAYRLVETEKIVEYGIQIQ